MVSDCVHMFMIFLTMGHSRPLLRLFSFFQTIQYLPFRIGYNGTKIYEVQQINVKSDLPGFELSTY